MAYDSFFLSYKNDRETKLRFNKIKQKLPAIQFVLVKKDTWEDNTLAECVNDLSQTVNTRHFWVIDPDVLVNDEFDFDYKPSEWDNNFLHYWNCEERNDTNRVVGIKLYKTKDVLIGNSDYLNSSYYLDVQHVLHSETIPVYSPTYNTYDVFFWDRGDNIGSQCYDELKVTYPSAIKISETNILKAHEYCRKTSLSDYYYFVFPEIKIRDDYKFDYVFKSYGDMEEKKPVVWKKYSSREAEYYGVGLFSTESNEFTEDQYLTFNFGECAVYEDEIIHYDYEYQIFYADDIKEVDGLVSSVDTKMFWIIDKNVEPFMDEIKKFIPNSYDQGIIHNFNIVLKTGKIVLNGVRLYPKNYDLSIQKNIDLVMGELKDIQIVKCRNISEVTITDDMRKFWIVNPDLDVIGSSIDDFYPTIYEEYGAYAFKIQSRTGNDLGYGGSILVYMNKDTVHLIDKFATIVPTPTRVPVYRSRDPYDVYKNKAKNDYFYWFVDLSVQVNEEFNFDFYPDMFSFDNVFTFNGAGGGSSIYFINRPHLKMFELTEEDFSFDRFKNIKHIDEIATKPINHPIFYFDEGLYPENTKTMMGIPDVEVIDAFDLPSAYQLAATKTTTGHFWAIDNDVELTDVNFQRSYFVDRYNKSHFIVWPKENPYTGLVYQYGGVKLCPSEAILHLKPDADKIRKSNFSNKIHVKTHVARSRDIKYDTVFLSYNEGFADENYEKLLKRIPSAKRVHGVKGIFNAHKKAAEIAETRMFYVVDADAILLDEFDFDYFPNYWEEDVVHTWRSKNPVNGLIYGYGGLKLFPTLLLRNATDWKVDFTTSVSDKFKPMQVVANYTAFNTDPFNTWKSAFRECSKLAANIIQRGDTTVNSERLKIWCEVGADKPFGEYAISGARMGAAYGNKYSSNETELSKINDFEWLKSKFEETYYDITNKRT